MSRRSFLNIFCIIPMALAIMSFRNIHGQVVCFGDSITYGAQVDGHSWVWFLTREHHSADFINAGRNGRRTSDKEELLPVLNKYPDANYYLIFLGVNDLKDGTDSMVNNCVENMNWMIRKIKETNSKAGIVILAPADIHLEAMNAINVQKKYNQNTKRSLYRLEQRYQELAKKKGVGFISLLHTVSGSNYADGLHPNPEGQKQIAEDVWKGLNRFF